MRNCSFNKQAFFNIEEYFFIVLELSELAILFSIVDMIGFKRQLTSPSLYA